jgi:hypothetical protein
MFTRAHNFVTFWARWIWSTPSHTFLYTFSYSLVLQMISLPWRSPQKKCIFLTCLIPELCMSLYLCNTTMATNSVIRRWVKNYLQCIVTKQYNKILYTSIIIPQGQNCFILWMWARVLASANMHIDQSSQQNKIKKIIFDTFWLTRLFISQLWMLER